jgi:hypothetical protein
VEAIGRPSLDIRNHVVVMVPVPVIVSHETDILQPLRMTREDLLDPFWVNNQYFGCRKLAGEPS